jgi:putative FmdB family regulatory protein
MPLYDIQCKNPECGHENEVMIHLDQVDQEIKCPDCGGVAAILITVVPPRHKSWGSWNNGG